MPFYHWYEMSHAAFAPLRAVADATKLYYDNPLNPLSHSAVGKNVSAACELFERSTRRYGKPVFGLETTEIDGIEVPVVEKTVWSRPFCNLVRFERANPTRRKTAAPEPKLLIVAPMSGHYATLLRGTVETMLPHYDVYVTDWIDARAVPMAEGSFDLDDYIDYLIQIFGVLGKGAHVMAVCQPSVPVLAAAALMDEADHPALPASLVLMGGPIDTRINPTAVNKMAEEKDLSWFEQNVVMTVPFPHPGFMRTVYPGFLQLTGFMSMNMDRHLDAHKEFFNHLVDGDGDSADKHTEFYDEYMAVMDLTSEFYLQTVDAVFIKHSLPKGELTYRGHLVDPSAIHRIALMTVEGENDDISGVGQTEAAHTLCTNLPEDMRAHYMQPKVGHFGVFNGSRFRSEIAPRIRDFTATHSERLSSVNAAPPAPKVKAAPAAPKVTAAAKPTATAKKPPAVAKTAPAPAREPVAAVKNAPVAAKTRKAAPKKVAAKPKNDLASLLLSKPQGAADDLKKISGVGPKLENTLNQTGIFHFAQIARLSQRAIDELDDKLAFKGRVARDKWVEQAKALSGAAAKDETVG
ncbi:polyhydroxyalkanoate depolymerase [Pararhizobium sp. IMCC21322]|uniref:polyhydroxyalkanoate depolymerase n=1 Tax=Pararhizobium sp. IMCC21322 TaxID=3067903 RepID=UPI00274089A0|nr:polyhydroxyalkanoate depolymerase [Pararhizobium sp. IMCC21322]